MTAFLADGDPPSDCTTMVLTPHTEGHTSGWNADPSRVDQTLVPINTLHGTQLAVEATVAAVFSTPFAESNNHPTHHEHQRPSSISSVVLPFTIDPDFIHEFNAFYDDFVQSPTYARAYSDNNRSSSIADDDDDDDDTLLSESDATSTTTSTQWLRLALRELEKVNRHICNVLNEPYPPRLHTPFSVNHPFPAMTVLPLPSVENPQHPKPCPEPPRECYPQHVSLRAPPPAPDPDALPPQRPATQIDFTACASAPCHPNRQPQSTPTPIQNCISLRAPPSAPDPAAIPPQRPATQIDCNAGIASARPPNRCPQSKTTPIPNWAKPAVPSTAVPMVGVVHTGTTHWSPPRPPMKNAPFKKKPQIKPVLATRRQEKDSLRPP